MDPHAWNKKEDSSGSDALVYLERYSLMLQVARDYNDQNIKATQCNFSRIDS